MFNRKPAGDGTIEPFRIVGNVYFVGTFKASSHIIDTGDGLIFIDPGYSADIDTVCASVKKLGFELGDIKYIVNTHHHGDHTQATARLAELSGAKTLIGRYDFDRARQYFYADIIIKDGDVLRLGNTEMHFTETPGHTKGTISFFFDTEHEGKTLRVGMFGGAGANTMVKGKFDFPEARESYRASINRLRGEKVDVFIGNHVWNNDTEIRGRILRETGVNLFIDDKLWSHFLDFCEARLDSVIAADNR